uniref:Uncharacterized protein n=1 Tax=Zea mays TaxID=4577 RepID=A0A804MIW0_MAIZE
MMPTAIDPGLTEFWWIDTRAIPENVARRGVSEGTRKQCRHHREKAGIAFTADKSYGLWRIRSPLHCLPCRAVFFISSLPIVVPVGDPSVAEGDLHKL